MPDEVRRDGFVVAHELVAQRFPQARAAWLGGSVAAGTATATSDLDITVLLDGAPAPYRASETFDDWPVEWFVQTENSLLRFCADDRDRRRRPTTMRLVGSSLVLADRDGAGQRLQRLLAEMDEHGPPPVSDEELARQRYVVTDLLGDLAAACSADERMTVAATLLRDAGDLRLARHRRWSGSGKWLLREINSLDTDRGTTYGTQLIHGLRAAAGNNAGPLYQTVLAILDETSGPLFDGYYRRAPAATLGAIPVLIEPTTADAVGIADLLALAVGPGERRLDEALREYRGGDSALVLLAAIHEGQPVGVLGYRISSEEVAMLHIATAPQLRRARVGTRLLAALRDASPPGLPIVAETDNDALGFYATNGFAITPLGEKYPGVNRFRVVLNVRADVSEKSAVGLVGPSKTQDADE